MTNDLDISPAPPPADWARQLLAFWFEAHGMDDWYGGGADFDEAVRDLAEGWHEALRSQPAESFLTDPDTALAATILFDQVPRNIYRGHADAFATDSLARAIARGIVERGWQENWPEERRQFACLPFSTARTSATSANRCACSRASTIRCSKIMRRSISTSSTASAASPTATKRSAARRVPRKKRR